MNKKIIKNSVKCKICGEILESVSEYEKVSCSCKNITIGGGFSTLLREGVNYEELSQYLLNE